MITTLRRDPDPEGDHVLRVDKVDRDDDAIVWQFTIDGSGSTIRHVTSVRPQSLWNLRHLLESLGIAVPDGPMALKLDEYAGLTVGAAIQDGAIIDFWAVDDGDGDQCHRPISPRLEIEVERATAALIARCQKAAGRRRRHTPRACDLD